MFGRHGSVSLRIGLRGAGVFRQNLYVEVIAYANCMDATGSRITPFPNTPPRRDQALVWFPFRSGAVDSIHDGQAKAFGIAFINDDPVKCLLVESPERCEKPTGDFV